MMKYIVALLSAAWLIGVLLLALGVLK